MTTETRRSFHSHLEAIRADVVRLAALVCESIPRGTLALLDGDVDAAAELVAADDEVDRLAFDIEERCYSELALQQPVASDMRALITAIRLASVIERSGDLMVNIAKVARRIRGMPIDARARGLVQTMSDEAQRLYRHAVDAYVEADEVKATALDAMDDDLDEAHHLFIDAIVESCRAGTMDAEVAVELGLVGRFYERIGDHAVNIGHRVRYLVSAWMPEAGYEERP